MKTILVPGTHGANDSWWRPNGLLFRYLKSIGHEPISFFWSTSLDGVLGMNDTWEHAAKRLTAFADRLGEVNIVTHSHGGQVVFYSHANIRTLITLATPVRSEMKEERQRTSFECSRWVHVHSDSSDYWQWLGSLFDGSLKFTRSMPESHKNVSVKGNRHEELLLPAIWEKHQIEKYLRKEEEVYALV